MSRNNTNFRPSSVNPCWVFAYWLHMLSVVIIIYGGGGGGGGWGFPDLLGKDFFDQF